MNFKTRLERLRERFLRAHTKPLIEAAKVEGGAILIHAQENGAIHYNESIREIVKGVSVNNPSNEAIQAMYFDCYASLESRDRTFHNGKRTQDLTIQNERYAAFCLELIDLLDAKSSQETPHPYKLYFAEYCQANPRVRYPKAAAAKAYWRIKLDKNERKEFADEESFVRSFKRYLGK